MKKIIFIFMAAFMPMVMFAKSNVVEKLGEVASESVSTVYEDGKGIVSTVYEDGKSLVSTVYEDGKQFLHDAYPEVKEAIVSIAHAIGVASEHVYTVLVKKFFVEGLTELFVFLVGFVLAIIGWVKFDKYVNKRPVLKKANGDEQMAPIDWHIMYPLAILVVGAVTLFNVNYHTMFLNLVNPEWGAINYILEFTKTLVH